MTLGSRVRAWRTNYGWTLDELSALSGVERGTIGAMELRESKRSDYTAQLAKAFGISVDELLDPSIPPSNRLGGQTAGERLPSSSTVHLSSVTTSRLAPVIDWASLGTDLKVKNEDVKGMEYIPVPADASASCKWVRVDKDMSRFGLRKGYKVAIEPITADAGPPIDGEVYLFKTPSGLFFLGEYRTLASGGFEAVPDAGLPLDSERHGITVEGHQAGMWK